MSTSVVVFGFGAMLILVAILGGGFELKEFKVPKVGWAPRLLAGIAGLVFVLWGAGMSGGTHEPAAVQASVLQTASTASVAPQPAAEPAVFTIYDQLGTNRVSEQITVTIDGRIVGQLTADLTNPRSMLSVTVPEPGRYSYTLDASRVVNEQGTLYRYTGAGQGTVSVQDGKKFELVESESSSPWIIGLIEQSELQKSQ